MDVNEPLQNPDLINAIEVMQAEHSAQAEAAFIQQLCKAHFLMLLEKGLEKAQRGTNGEFTLEKGTVISLPMLTDRDGNQWFFAFTDWDALHHWNPLPGQQTLLVPFSDWPAMVLQEHCKAVGIIINPSTHNLPISQALLSHLDGRIDSNAVSEAAQVVIGKPEELPGPLSTSIKKALRRMREVKQAWLLYMVQGEEQSYLIIVDHSGDRTLVSKTIGSAAAPHLPKGLYLDVAHYSDDFGKNAATGHDPFYKKSWFPLL